MPEDGRNSARFRAACKVIAGGVNTSLRRFLPQLVFSRAQGATITDVAGEDYIDYHAAETVDRTLQASEDALKALTRAGAGELAAFPARG